MRVLAVDRVEQHGPVAVLFGTVENERIIVGQDVLVVSRSGVCDPAIITSILPDYEGLKEFDEGSVGRRVKVTFRRRPASFPDLDIVALETRSD